MGLKTNRTLSVWDGERVDTASETLEGAAKGVRPQESMAGSWRAVTDIEELDSYHRPVARRRFQVLRAGVRTRRGRRAAQRPARFRRSARSRRSMSCAAHRPTQAA